MPELPEVETVRTGLEKLIIGKKIIAITHDWEKSFPNDPAIVSEFAINSKITAVKRRAKVLLIELSTSYTLMTHLKMTGQLVYVGDERFGAGHPNDSLINKLPDKSTRVAVCLISKKSDALAKSARKNRETEQTVRKVQSVSIGDFDGAITQEHWQRLGVSHNPGQCDAHLFFNDQRKFGWMKLLPKELVLEEPFMQKVGPEPLEKSFSDKIFVQRVMRRKNSCIKAVILDQTVLAGVGNIYADESLWGAKIHPATLVKDIPVSKLKKLHQEILYVLKLSIDKGGSTDRNYVNAEGKRGSYIDFARVFRKEGQPCQRCGSSIEKIRVAARGTHICPNCQLYK